MALATVHKYSQLTPLDSSVNPSCLFPQTLSLNNMMRFFHIFILHTRFLCLQRLSIYIGTQTQIEVLSCNLLIWWGFIEALFSYYYSSFRFFQWNQMDRGFRWFESLSRWINEIVWIFSSTILLPFLLYMYFLKHFIGWLYLTCACYILWVTEFKFVL